MDPQAFQKRNRGRFTGQHEFLVLEQRSGSETPATHPASVSRERHFPSLCLSFPTCDQHWHFCALQAVQTLEIVTPLVVPRFPLDIHSTFLPWSICCCTPSAPLIWISSSGVLVLTAFQIGPVNSLFIWWLADTVPVTALVASLPYGKHSRWLIQIFFF